MAENLVYRTAKIEQGEERSFIDVEARTVELSFSSDEPYNRGSYIEVLDHTPEGVDLTRLEQAGSLLVDHDWKDIVGTIEKVWLDTTGRVARAKVRFGRSVRANEVFQDVADGIRKTVSVGYIRTKVGEDGTTEDGTPIYRFSFAPYEISLVAVPADITVGVGREMEANTQDKEIEPVQEEQEERNTIMSDEMKYTDEQIREIEKNIMEKATRSERERVNSIRAVADSVRHLLPKVDEMVNDFVNSERHVADFQAEVLSRMENIQQPAIQPDNSTTEIGMSEKEKGTYSLQKAMSALISNDWSDAGLEREASRAIGQTNGIYIPFDVFQRADAAGTTTSAAGAIPTATDPNFVQALFNRSVVVNLGATMKPGLVGNHKIPVVVSGTPAEWIAEDGSTSDSSAMTISNVTLSPKTLRAKQPYTREFGVSAPNAEMMVKDWISKTVSTALDKAVLAASSGATASPTGILYKDGVDIVTIGSGLTYAKMVELETKVANENADFGRLAYVTNSNIAGSLKTTLRDSGVSGYILENGQVNGYPMAVTNSIPASGMCFGNFEDVAVGIWGQGIELQVDPYSSADSGWVIVRAFLHADSQVLRTDSFSRALDISV